MDNYRIRVIDFLVNTVVLLILTLSPFALTGQSDNNEANCFMRLENYDGISTVFDDSGVGEISCELKSVTGSLGDNDFLIGGINLYTQEYSFSGTEGIAYSKSMHLSNLDLAAQGYLVFFTNYANEKNGEASMELSLPYTGGFMAFDDLERRVINYRLNKVFEENVNESVKHATFLVIKRLVAMLSGSESVEGTLIEMGLVELEFEAGLELPDLDIHTDPFSVGYLSANIYDYSKLRYDESFLGEIIERDPEFQRLGVTVYLTSNLNDQTLDEMNRAAIDFGKDSELFSLWLHYEYDTLGTYKIFGASHTNITEKDALIFLVNHFENSPGNNLPSLRAENSSRDEAKSMQDSTAYCFGKPSSLPEFFDSVRVGKYIHGRDWNMYCFFANDYIDLPSLDSFDDVLQVYEETYVGTSVGLGEGLLGFGFGIGQLLKGVNFVQETVEPVSFLKSLILDTIKEKSFQKAWSMKVGDMKILYSLFKSIVSLVVTNPIVIQSLIVVEIFKYLKSISGSSALFNASYISGLILFEVLMEVLSLGSAAAATITTKLASYGVDLGSFGAKYSRLGYDNAVEVLDVNNWNNVADRLENAPGGMWDYGSLASRKTAAASIHGNCFLGATLIALSGGLNAAPIEDIEVFDLVESRVMYEDSAPDFQIGSDVYAWESSDDALFVPESSPVWSVAELIGNEGEVLSLARPEKWFKDHAVEVGENVNVELSELNLSGEFYVSSLRQATIKEQAALLASGTSQPVLATVNYKAPVVLRLITTDDTIGVTPGHPFYSEDRDQWVRAGNLLPGEKLASINGGQSVMRIDTLKGEKGRVYNLEVRDNHNFYVGTGGVLVHNSCLEYVQEIIRKFPDDGPGNIRLDLDIPPGVADLLGDATDEISSFIANLSKAKKQALLEDLNSIIPADRGKIVKRVKEWEVLFPDAFIRKDPTALNKISSYNKHFGRSFESIAQEFRNVPISQRNSWVNHLEFRTNGASVLKPGSRIDEYRSWAPDGPNATPLHYSMEPSFSTTRLDPTNLCYDPATQQLSGKTIQEAMAGIEASKYQDLLPWPISRETSGKMEFFDANGIPWDVKGPRSGISPSGNSFFNVESSGGSILKELREKKQFQTDPVGGTFRNNLTGDIEYRRIILDTTWLNVADYLALKNWMQQNLSFDELNRIVEVNSNLF